MLVYCPHVLLKEGQECQISESLRPLRIDKTSSDMVLEPGAPLYFCVCFYFEKQSFLQIIF